MDVDDFGWPRASLQDVSEEQLRAVTLRRQAITERHGSKLKVPEPGCRISDVVKSHMTAEEFEELGYPEVPEELKSGTLETTSLDEVDPRVNPNLMLQCNEQEFWFNAARKPYAKAILRSEQHWTQRRNVWIRQYDNVELMNAKRADIMEALEECSSDVKRIVAPVVHYKIMETTLSELVRLAMDENISLDRLLQNEEKFALLCGLRRKLDAGGPAAAKALMDEYDGRRGTLLRERKLQQDSEVKECVSDTDTMVRCLNLAQKCKKDGSLEWEQGHYHEALASWRQGDAYLKGRKMSEKGGSQILAELHISILKNLAEAALKLEYWTEALDAANDALSIDEDDHKAWFRRACALEGVGKLEMAEEALNRIDAIAVGRCDADRIRKETRARRDIIQMVRSNHEKVERRCVQLATKKGVFAAHRNTAEPPSLQAVISAVPLKIDTCTSRKRLTRDGAADILEDLRHAFADTLFQKQVSKLATDVRFERQPFLAHLQYVMLDVQRPILSKWGFAPSVEGAQEMQCAVQDHINGVNGDSVLAAKDDLVKRLTHGQMYGRIFDATGVVSLFSEEDVDELAPVMGEDLEEDDDTDCELEELT